MFQASQNLIFVIYLRLKGNKKEEQYRLLWAELETLLIASTLSPGHKAVLQCIRECRSRGPDQGADKLELDQAIRELDNIDTSKRLSVIKATTDSPMSPPLTIPNDMLNLNKSKSSFGNGNKLVALLRYI